MLANGCGTTSDIAGHAADVACRTLCSAGRSGVVRRTPCRRFAGAPTLQFCGGVLSMPQAAVIDPVANRSHVIATRPRREAIDAACRALHWTCGEHSDASRGDRHGRIDVVPEPRRRQRHLLEADRFHREKRVRYASGRYPARTSHERLRLHPARRGSGTHCRSESRRGRGRSSRSRNHDCVDDRHRTIRLCVGGRQRGRRRGRHRSRRASAQRDGRARVDVIGRGRRAAAIAPPRHDATATAREIRMPLAVRLTW